MNDVDKLIKLLNKLKNEGYTEIYYSDIKLNGEKPITISVAEKTKDRIYFEIKTSKSNIL